MVTEALMSPLYVLKALQFLHAQMKLIIELLDLVKVIIAVLINSDCNTNIINTSSHCLQEQMCKTPCVNTSDLQAMPFVF